MRKFSPFSAVHNRRIVDPDGKYVGHVHDVLLDLRDGRIEYVCIAMENGEPSRPTEAVVPWSAVKVDPARNAQWQVAAGRPVLQAIAQPVSSRK